MNQKRGQESSSSLAYTLGASKDQDTVHINNNMQTLAMAKEQYRFGKQGENSRGQNFSPIRFVLLNKP